MTEPTRSHIPTMAHHLRDHMATQASHADSYASAGEAMQTENATLVGKLAYLQHGIAHARALFAQDLEHSIRSEGLLAEDIAEGLAEHGIATTAQQLREAYPQITVMESQVRWMLEHAADYLPLVHRVSRLVPAYPGMVRVDHLHDAERCNRLIAMALADRQWDGTRKGLNSIEAGQLMQFAPSATAYVWLSHMHVEVLPFGLARDHAFALQEKVAKYHELGRKASEDRPAKTDDQTVLPLHALHDAVTSEYDATPINLHLITQLQ